MASLGMNALVRELKQEGASIREALQAEQVGWLGWGFVRSVATRPHWHER